MSNTPRSRDARRVTDKLAKVGVAIEGESLFDVEVTCSRFFPNHIEGVIDQVLRGGNVATKLERAQEQGWPYFEKPVRSLLAKRAGAQRAPSPPTVVNENTARRMYRLVITGLLLADMTREEADLLLFQVPILAQDKSTVEIGEAIRICKERDARSVYYFHGVLSRHEQMTQGRIGEILRERGGNAPWMPDPDFAPVDIATRARLLLDWKDRLNSIDIVRRYHEKD